MVDADRAEAMAASVQRTARSFGVPVDGLALIGRAHALAMGPRLKSLSDDHHPAYLHPGRSVLILLRDVGLTDPVTLAATALVESEDAALRVDPGGVRADLGAEVADILLVVPQPGAENLVERLVTAPEAVVYAALADRLDHVRHLHLRGDDRSGWSEILRETEEVWLPIAERTHARLATRFRHWHRTFGRRWERERNAEGG